MATAPRQMGPRRVAAIFLPSFACEVALAARGVDPSSVRTPIAVVFSEEEVATADTAAAVVGAVSGSAAARGVRPGMRVGEAMARAADLVFERITPRVLVHALGAVAEVAMEFGVTVSLDAGGWPPGDTVWVDVTGASHLFGGEAALCDAIEERVGVLGHHAAVAIAGGPHIARALAQHGGSAPRVTPPGTDKQAIADLPLGALPIPAELCAYFTRLGVITIADLARLDRAQLVARLEAFASSSKARASRASARAAPPARAVLGWLDGHDPAELVPYHPPEVLIEEVGFDDGVETAPQLVFALRGAVSKLSARLTGRRQAASRIDIAIGYDRAIHRLRGNAVEGDPTARLFVDLPAPLSHTDDLFRAVKAKIERLELAAPAVRIALALSRIARAPEVQLDLARDVSVSPDALPALLSELSAEIGVERVGVLSVVDDHRPEMRTRLVGVIDAHRDAAKSRGDVPPALDAGEPLRLLPEPVFLGRALQPRDDVFIGCDTFTLDSLAFDRRLDSVAWWSSSPCSRDYYRAVFSPVAVAPSQTQMQTQAWVYVDRLSNELRIHGWWE